MKIKWNKSRGKLAKEKAAGKENMLFLASNAARLMDPYVPADNLVLAQNIQITADDDCGHVTYNSQYAHYQYTGEVYGPNYPLTDGGEVVGFWSPPHKTPTGKHLEYSTFRHPLATDHWDKAMTTARGDELAEAYEAHLKGKG